MSTPYGVHPTGFVRKPLSVILSEIETDMVEVFGEKVVQTSESPLGQINGIVAETVARLWELGEDIYQSIDPDQAEGTRLDSLAKLRLLERSGIADIDLRKEIHNRGVNKFNLKDVEQSLIGLSGITYLQSFLNDDGGLNGEGLAVGDVAIAIIGGDNTEIADKLITVMPIGGNTFGNTVISTSAASGISQSFNLLRVAEVRIELSLEISLNNDTYNLFQPDTQQIIEGLVQGWAADRVNGRDVDSYAIRRIIESKYPVVKLEHFTATVNGGVQQSEDAPAVIDFDQVASIVAEDITAVFV